MKCKATGFRGIYGHLSKRNTPGEAYPDLYRFPDEAGVCSMSRGPYKHLCIPESLQRMVYEKKKHEQHKEKPRIKQHRRWLGRLKRNWKRRLIVALNVVLNVGMLVWFKYFNLLAEAFASITSTRFDPLEIILPAGITRHNP